MDIINNSQYVPQSHIYDTNFCNLLPSQYEYPDNFYPHRIAAVSIQNSRMNPFAKPFVPSFAAKQEMSADEIFCDPKVQYYSTLQMLFEEEGSSDEMNEYYSEEKSESFSSDSNADAVVTEKENFSIKSISQIAPQHRKNYVTVTEKIKKSASEGILAFETALDGFYDLMSEGKIPDNVMLSTIFSTCAKLSPPAVNTALQVWNQVKDLSTRFNTVAINALINVFATSGDIKNSEYFFRKLELYGLKPDVNSYNSLIFACCENKPLPNYERARFWFDSISANGLKPDDYSYSSLISAAAKSNNVESGLRFFREMKMQGIRPNLQSLTSVLKLCAKSFDLETALKVVEETQNCGPQPDIYFWNSFLNVCIKCNQLRRIFETWRVLLASDSAARPDTSTFNTALEACGRLGDVQELVAVLQEGLQEKVQLNRYSFSAMVNGCIDAGHSATAVKWFLELEAAFPWSLVLLSSLFRVIQRGSKLLEPLQPEEKRRCAEQFERYRLDAEGLTDGSKKGLIRKEYKAVLLHTFEKARKMGMFAENVRLEEESLLSLVGLPGPVAEVALTHSLALVQRIFARSEKVGRLEIVTGKGRIKQCCLNFMRSKNLEYSQHPKNAGRFIVSEANLKKFLLHIKKWPGYVL